MHRIQTVEAHTAGEPLRIITSGFPELRGETVLERVRLHILCSLPLTSWRSLP